MIVGVLAAVIGVTTGLLIDRVAPDPCKAAVEYITATEPVVPHSVAERDYIDNVDRCLGK